MKKILSAVIAATMIFSAIAMFTSCDKKAEPEDGKYTVGICQLAPHVALDAATKGFREQLEKELGKENVTFIEQNAQGQNDVCATIVNDFVSKDVDLIMANATAALQAAYNGTTTIPVLGTSITEYGTALDIKDFNGTVGGNVSGTSDLAPLDKQAEIITEIFPEAKKVAMLYCSSEANSDYQIKVIEAKLAEMGLEAQRFSFTDSNDVTSVAAAAAAAADVVYIPTDNTAANCTGAILGALGNVPSICGEEGICLGCGVATLSISYYDLGVATGKMAAKILKGEAKVSEMPIEYAATSTKKYNKARCDELGIDTAALDALGYVAIEG